MDWKELLRRALNVSGEEKLDEGRKILLVVKK